MFPVFIFWIYRVVVVFGNRIPLHSLYMQTLDNLQKYKKTFKTLLFITFFNAILWKFLIFPFFSPLLVHRHLCSMVNHQELILVFTDSHTMSLSAKRWFNSSSQNARYHSSTVSAAKLRLLSPLQKGAYFEVGSVIKLIIVHAQRDVTIHLAGILYRRTDARLCASEDVCPPFGRDRLAVCSNNRQQRWQAILVKRDRKI